MAQNPISASIQSRSIPSVTASAAFLATTEPPYPWDEIHCDLSSEEIAKVSEIASRVRHLPTILLLSCLSPDSISEAPECQALQELADLLSQKCFTPPDDDDSVTSSAWNLCRNDTDESDEPDDSPPDILWVIEEGHGRAILYICGKYLAFETNPLCKEFKKSIQWRRSCPEAPNCQYLWRVVAEAGIKFWEPSRVNDTSCASTSPDLPLRPSRRRISPDARRQTRAARSCRRAVSFKPETSL